MRKAQRVMLAPDIAESLCPREGDWEYWKMWLPAEPTVDPDGWWWGWCPMHDTERSPDKFTAQIGFHRNSMRCLGEPSCHAPKRAIALTNAIIVVHNTQWQG